MEMQSHPNVPALTDQSKETKQPDSLLEFYAYCVESEWAPGLSGANDKKVSADYTTVDRGCSDLQLRSKITLRI